MSVLGRGYVNSPSGLVYKGNSFLKWQPIEKGTLMIHDVQGVDTSYYASAAFFKSPSEHTVNGKHYDLEMQIVHLTKAANPGAVIAIFFDRMEGGTENNKFLGQLQPNLATGKGYTTEGPVNFKEFLSTVNFSKYWQYQGSLTTPPCTEGITWTLITNVQTISQVQLDWFQTLWQNNKKFANGNGNNRAVQPLNSRQIY